MSSELRVDKIIPTAGVPTGGAGGVIQVVGTMNTTQVSTTATALGSPTDSGMSVVITPKFATSKILIMVNASMRGDGGSAYVNALIKRNGTLINYSPCSDDGILDYAINHTAGNSSWNFFDSPNSTSALTYGFFFTRYGGSGTAYFNNNGNHYSCSTMTAMELSA